MEGDLIMDEKIEEKALDTYADAQEASSAQPEEPSGPVTTEEINEFLEKVGADQSTFYSGPILDDMYLNDLGAQENLSYNDMIDIAQGNIPNHQEQPQKASAELEDEIDEINYDEEDDPLEDEMNPTKAEQKAKGEAISLQAEDKEGLFKKIWNTFVHVIRYVIDPIYRHDCQNAAALERRADLNAQVKAYEQRKADKIKEKLEPDKDKEMIVEKQDQILDTEHTADTKFFSDFTLAETLNLLDMAKKDISAMQSYSQNQQTNILINLLKKDIDKSYSSNDSIYKNTAADCLRTVINAWAANVQDDKNAEFHKLSVTDRLYLLNPDYDRSTNTPGSFNEQLFRSASRLMDMTMEIEDKSLENYIDENPSSIIFLSPDKVTTDMAKNAYDHFKTKAAVNFMKKNPDRDFDEKEERKLQKNLIIKYPQLSAAFDPISQKKNLLVHAAIQSPEALAFMSAEVGTDKKTLQYLEKQIEYHNSKLDEHVTKLDFSVIENTLANVIQQFGPENAAGTLLQNIDAEITHENRDLTTIMESFGNNIEIEWHEEEQKNIAIPEDHLPTTDPDLTPNEPFDQTIPQREDIPIPEQSYTIDSSLSQNEPSEQPQENYNMPPEDFFQAVEEEPITPVEDYCIPWDQKPEFSEAIEEARKNLNTQHHGLQAMMIHEVTPEDIKIEIMKEQPGLYQYLPNEDKTIAATVEAVSRDLSLIKFVPDEDLMPEYEDRDELKKQILDHAEDLIRQECLQQDIDTISPMYVIKSEYGTCNGDTKEAKELKKEIKARGFKIHEDVCHSQGNDLSY